MIDLHGLPRQIAPMPKRPPDGMPRGWGERLWFGTQHVHEEHIIEHVLRAHVDLPRLDVRSGEPFLRLRASATGQLLGVFAGVLDRRGHCQSVPTALEGFAAGLERVMVNGFRWAPGVVVQTVEECLDGVVVAGKGAYSVREVRRVKRRVAKRAPLYQVAWDGCRYASALACSLEHAQPARFVRSMDDSVITMDRELATLGEQRGGERWRWWRELDDVTRGEWAADLLNHGRALLDDPPPWEWWAGTIRRCDGFVGRSSYSGARQVLGVRAWDATKRSAIRTIVRRFVRPPPILPMPAPQQELFA